MHAGSLPGTVFGRLDNCVAACDKVAEVNTALSCIANLASTIVVSDRATALAVLEHIRQKRAGVVKCLIVDEAACMDRAAAAVPQSLQGMHAQPLAQCVVAQAGFEAALPLVQGLLAQWLVVPDWKAAEQCAQAQKSSRSRCGIITRCASSPAR